MESGLLALWPLTWLLKGRPSLWTACAMWLVLTVASSAIWQPRQDRLICLHLAVPATETTWAQVLVSKGRVTELWEPELTPSLPREECSRDGNEVCCNLCALAERLPRRPGGVTD